MWRYHRAAGSKTRSGPCGRGPGRSQRRDRWGQAGCCWRSRRARTRGRWSCRRPRTGPETRRVPAANYRREINQATMTRFKDKVPGARGKRATLVLGVSCSVLVAKRLGGVEEGSGWSRACFQRLYGARRRIGKFLRHDYPTRWSRRRKSA